MISIVIPTHNRRRNVELTLTGLKLQTLPQDKFEVILIDDGSTDGTHELLESFKDELKFKYAWLHKKDAWNASRPRNYGAKLAEKETTAFLFLDSDVVLNRKALESYWEDLEKDKNRVVIGPYDWTAPQNIAPSDIENRFDDFANSRLPKQMVRGRLGTIGPDMRIPSFKDAGGDPNKLYDRVFDALACFGGNLLVPRHIFWKAGGYDEKVLCGIEDGDFGITLWRQGVKFSYDERTMGHHAWHAIPDSRFPYNLRAHIDKLNLKHFGEKDPDLGIIQHTREAFKLWGVPDWNPPPEWEMQEKPKK